MNIVASGSGWGTGPGQIVWFCHLCHSSYVLPQGSYHVCKPQLPPDSVRERPTA